MDRGRTEPFHRSLIQTTSQAPTGVGQLSDSTVERSMRGWAVSRLATLASGRTWCLELRLIDTKAQSRCQRLAPIGHHLSVE